MPEKISNPGMLKAFYDHGYVQRLGRSLAEVEGSFDATAFESLAGDGLADLELKARTEQICAAMGQCLPKDFATAVAVVQRAMGDPGPEPDDEGMGGFEFWPHVTFLSAFGLSNPEAALRAMRFFTQHYSCEFAVRAFLIEHPDLALEHVRQWSQDHDWRVRRLASEGTRPRLPWGQQIKAFIANPEPVVALLNGLHNDPRLIVRRSVANNLNDIAKDHPDRAVEAAAAWFNTGQPGSQWTVKHGLRPLIKQGHRGALAILGFEGGEGVEVSELHLDPAQPHIGSTADLSFTVLNRETGIVNVVIDYALGRTLAKGKRGEKVFKLRNMALKPDQAVTVATTLRFKQLSTPTYYPGPHAVRILINGRVAAERLFRLN